MSELSIQEITMHEGEAKTFPHVWTEKATGSPIDLSGSSIKYNLVIDESDTLGRISKGGQIVIKYIVKSVSASGDVRYIYKLYLTVIGVHDD